jgi:hypothetical protein
MTRMSPKKIALAAVALTVALSMLLTPAPPAGAADHGDAPYVNGDQSVDAADTFVFLDPNDNTRVILAFTLRGFIASGENINFGQFDPNVRHRFEIETTGDARADRFIDVTFSKRTAPTAPQVATVTLMDGQTFTANSTPPSVCISGTASCPPAPTITNLGTTGVMFFAGQRDDPFNFDIPAFVAATTALRACVANPAPPPNCVSDALANFQRGRDSFAGYNLMSIVLSIPRTVFTAAGAGTSIGIIGLLQRRSPTLYPGSPDVVRANNTSAGFGRWQTLDRIATPAVNVALIPFARKEEYNSATTQDDASGRFAADIVASLTALGTNATNIGILAGIAVTNGDFLRLNLNTANTTLGFGEEFHSTPGYTGFPNGRRFGDDVVDTELFFIANQPAGGLTDNANQNEQPFLSTFPFLSPPHQPRPAGVIDDQTRN